MSTFDFEPTTFTVKHKWTGTMIYQFVREGYGYYPGSEDPEYHNPLTLSPTVYIGDGSSPIHVGPVYSNGRDGDLYRQSVDLHVPGGFTLTASWLVGGDGGRIVGHTQTIHFEVEVEYPVHMEAELSALTPLGTVCYCDVGTEDKAIWCPYPTAKDPNWLPDEVLDIRYAIPTGVDEGVITASLSVGEEAAVTGHSHFDAEGAEGALGIMSTSIYVGAVPESYKVEPWGEVARVTMTREGCSELSQDNVVYTANASWNNEGYWEEEGFEVLKIENNNTLVLTSPCNWSGLLGARDYSWTSTIGAYDSDLGAAVAYLDGHLIPDAGVLVPEFVPVAYDPTHTIIVNPLAIPYAIVDYWAEDTGAEHPGFTPIVSAVGAKLESGGDWHMAGLTELVGPYKDAYGDAADFAEHSATLIDGVYTRTLGPAIVEDPGALGQPDFATVAVGGCGSTAYEDCRMPIAIGSPSTVIGSALQITCRERAHIAEFAYGDQAGWTGNAGFTWTDDGGLPCGLAGAGASLEIDLGAAPIMLGARFAELLVRSANATGLSVEIAGRDYSAAPGVPKTETIRPDDDVSAQAWTPSAGNAWQCVSDSSDATYIYTDPPDANDEYTLGNLGDVFRAFKLVFHIRYKQLSAGSSEVQGYINNGAATLGSDTFVCSDTGWIDGSFTVDGLKLTQAEVNNLTVGITAISGNTLRVADVSVDVTYIPVGAQSRIDLLGPSNFPSPNPFTQSLIPTFLPEQTTPPTVTDIPFDWGVYKPGTLKISGFVEGASYTFDGLDVVAVAAPYVQIFPEPQWVGFQPDIARDPGSDPFAFQSAGVAGDLTVYYQRIGYLIQDGAVAAEIVSVKHIRDDGVTPGWSVYAPSINEAQGAYELFAFPHHELALHSVAASGSTASGGLGSVSDMPLAHLTSGTHVPSAGVISVPACLRVTKVTFPANYSNFTPVFYKGYGGAALVRIPNSLNARAVHVVEGEDGGAYTADSDTSGTFLSFGNPTVTRTISQANEHTAITIDSDAASTFDLSIRNRALSFATALVTAIHGILYDHATGAMHYHVDGMPEYL
jgi:hypothetical protein